MSGGTQNLGNNRERDFGRVSAAYVETNRTADSVYVVVITPQLAEQVGSHRVGVLTPKRTDIKAGGAENLHQDRRLPFVVVKQQD